MADPGLEHFRMLHREISAWIADAGAESRYAPLVGPLPELFDLLCRLCIDPAAGTGERRKLLGAILYVADPVDLAAEKLIGPEGYADDSALAALVLKTVADATSTEPLNRLWIGEPMPVIDGILAKASLLLGAELWRRVVAKVESW